MNWRGWIAPPPSAEGRSSPKITAPACLVGLAGVAYFLLCSRPFQIPYDDAYITLEFARNLAATGHLTFDGTHIAPGTTTPLHVMLLATVAKLSLPLELADVTLGILFFILLIQRTGAVAMYLTKSWEASLYAALVTALTGYFVLDALNGLETTLFMFLSVTCFGSLIKSCERGGRYLWPALWLYLTALTRPEGYWFAVGLMLYLITRALRQREEMRRLATLSGCVVGATLLALATQWLFTGSPSPHTALAKVYFFDEFHRPFKVRLAIYTRDMKSIGGPLILSLLPLFWARRARPALVAILPWIVISQLLFLILFPSSISAYEGRYVHLVLPFLFILAGDGVHTLLHSTGKYRIPRWATAMILVCIASICYFNLLTVRASYDNEKVAIRNNHFWAVKWLQANAPPGILIATHDIGVLRYYGNYQLLDIAGLVDEDAMATNRAQSGQFDYLIKKRPDYIVADGWWLLHYAHYPQSAFRRYATTVAVARPNAYEVVQLRIYRCHWDQPGNGPRQAEFSSPIDRF